MEVVMTITMAALFLVLVIPVVGVVLGLRTFLSIRRPIPKNLPPTTQSSGRFSPPSSEITPTSKRAAMNSLSQAYVRTGSASFSTATGASSKDNSSTNSVPIVTSRILEVYPLTAHDFSRWIGDGMPPVWYCGGRPYPMDAITLRMNLNSMGMWPGK